MKISEKKLTEIKIEMVSDLLKKRPDAMPISNRKWDLCFTMHDNMLMLWYDTPGMLRGKPYPNSGVIRKDLTEWTED